MDSDSVSQSIKGFTGTTISWREGTFTGEISSEMLVDAGCSHVIIGHSECRQFFCETDEAVNRKIGTSLSANLIPVFCIGETELQREDGETFPEFDKQVRDGLKGFAIKAQSGLVAADEPVWAIGTGKTDLRKIQSILNFIIRRPTRAKNTVGVISSENPTIGIYALIMFITGIDDTGGRMTWVTIIGPYGSGKCTTAIAGNHIEADSLVWKRAGQNFREHTTHI